MRLAKLNQWGLPLRTWLVIILLGVTTIGLAGSSIAVNSLMKQVVLNQVDEELYSTMEREWPQTLNSQSNLMQLPSQYAVQIVFLTDQGTPMQISFLGEGAAQPDFTELEYDDGPQFIGSEGEETTIWRATMGVMPDGSIMMIARDLTSQYRTLQGLSLVQASISLLTLIVVGIMGTWFIRRALRPLTEVEKTAQAISAGQLDRRVPLWPLNTEVGRLANALNIMLARLQQSVESAQDSAQAAQDKEEQMRRFVGDASHELRTPLTSLRGYVELYRSGATDDVDFVLGKIDAESARMKLLVEDLLALNRAEGSRLEKKQVDLLELGLATASSARAAWPGRDIEVINNTAGVPIIDGDPARLHQVLSNLINNAFNHGGEDARVVITLSSDKYSEVIEVSDDGAGMDEETAKHIFERFYRADSSRWRGSGGSGLGLSIVKSLVDMHQGEITVQSSPGEGTTFRIILPRVESH